jgi:hypothetical protein
MTDSGMEAPVDDALEQHQSAGGGSDEDAERDEREGTEWPTQVPLYADEADTADQERTVELDEDDYR